MKKQTNMLNKMNTRNIVRGLIAALSPASAGLVYAQTNTPDSTETKEQHEARDARIGWWREGRFGMFIHWGLCLETEK